MYNFANYKINDIRKMKLEIDCTWNEGINKGKVVIVFDNRPKTIFQMDNEKIAHLKALEKDFLLKGPKILDEFLEVHKNNPKSLWAAVTYFHALRSYEYFDDAKETFKKIKKRYPNEVFTKIIQGYYLLENKDLKGFTDLFLNCEVLKGAFPQRKIFHFLEALYFHSVWRDYFSVCSNVYQAEKHFKFVAMISNFLASFS